MSVLSVRKVATVQLFALRRLDVQATMLWGTVQIRLLILASGICSVVFVAVRVLYGWKALRGIALLILNIFLLVVKAVMDLAFLVVMERSIDILVIAEPTRTWSRLQFDTVMLPRTLRFEFVFSKSLFRSNIIVGVDCLLFDFIMFKFVECYSGLT